MRELQNSSFKYFYNFKPHKIFSPIFTQDAIQSLKSLASNNNIIITKPDKGQGVVIVNKNDYIISMQAIITYLYIDIHTMYINIYIHSMY